MTTEAAKSLLERNKAVALRFKKSQGTPQQEEAMREVLNPDYKRIRGGMFQLEQNAHGADFPGPGKFLRTAFPDRVDAMEDVIAEGDRVGLLFKLSATHKAGFLGVPATGKRVSTYECAMLRIVNGQMVEGWFMADEAALLKQFGAGFPRRPDGRQIVPQVTGGGQDPEAVLAQLKSASSAEDRNRRAVVQAAAARGAPGVDVRRSPFPTLEEYGAAHGAARQGFAQAFQDWRERVDVTIAEDSRVWMRSTLTGTHTQPFYGLPATGKRVEVSQLTIARFEDGRWRDVWYMTDELGLALQLDALHMVS
jgi:predicted ester cyclase